MSVIIVGGNDRMSTRYKEICKSYNCKAKVYIKIPANFDKHIGSPDLAIVFTDTVSHKMLIGLRKGAGKNDFPVEICHSSSCSALKHALDKHCSS